MIHLLTLIPRLWAFRSALIAAALLLVALAGMAGSWTTLRNDAPDSVELMLLLSDGTVMAQQAGASSNWYRLTPDIHGSYTNGTWSTLAPMHFTHQYYSSAVLRDGRVFVAGGEYGTGGNTAEIYDPVNDFWTEIPVPVGLICTNCNSPGFSDAASVILPDGRVLIAPVRPITPNGTVIYDPVSNTFSNGPACLVNQNEASWVKLPDDSILTIDPTSNPNLLNSSERYIPSLNNGQGGWIADQSLPVPMYNSATEIGAGVLLPDGRAFFIGGNGQTVYYTPSGNTSQGNWTVGPTLVSPGVGWDEPAAMMVNGKVLFQTVLGPPQNPQPRAFYEMDPTNNYPIGTITETPEWGDNSGTSHIMLNAPDGNVLVTYGTNTIRVYQPDGVPIAAGKPTITRITPNADGSYHLTGTQLNGISQGSSFGDDAQMDSNYPLVRLIADSGEVTYARTFNWSSTGVKSNAQNVSTEFTIPSVVPGTGAIHLEVVANGIASDPVPLPLVRPAETLTFSGTESMGAVPYEIRGGITIFEDDGSASGLLLRGDGGLVQLFDSATAGTATIRVDGGIGNGGLSGHLRFYGNSTAAAADILNHTGALGPNFKNASPNPMDGLPGETRFYDNATAGTARITNEGESDNGASSGQSGGLTVFAGNASADHGTFVTQGATIANGRGGSVEFTENATADHGIFRNLNSNNGSQYSQGRTVFFDSTTAGQGVFTNVGGDGGFLETGGTTEFRGSSSAGNATFINEGPTGGSFPQRGNTQFFDTATAATATFTNRPGVGGGGGVEFYGHSTAAAGNFVNDGTSAVGGVSGGEVMFKEDSEAGQANFHTTGQYGGFITFHNRTSADHGTFLIDPDLYNSRIVFDGSSTAGNAAFEIGGGAYLQFFESSTAGSATILLHGNGGAGSLGGFQSGSAGNAAITVMGAERNGAVGASLGFQAPATAGNSTIIINGASVTTFGASGGIARFDYSASAGAATIVANGGSNGGAGARIEFARGATAAQARFVLNAGSTLDVSGNVFSGGTPAGSIEGAGGISLGRSLLTVGFLNTSTVFSGVISDDSNPNVGYLANGQLTKEGAGTLTLSGANTYSGITTVNAGTLVVNGSLAGGVQVNAGAALKGSGSIGGTVTVAPGGIVAPGNSPGTLTIWSNYSQGPQGALEIEVAGPNPENRDLLIVKGNVDLGGTLLLVFSGYAPSATETFPVLEAAGSFNENNLNIVVLGLKPGFQPSYQFSNGKLTVTATSSGQLRTPDDPIQVLKPWFTSQSGFVYPVFTLAGLTYQFDTSTDLETWTRVSDYPGANVLVEFRHIPPTADSYRFYRVVQKGGTP